MYVAQKKMPILFFVSRPKKCRILATPPGRILKVSETQGIPSAEILKFPDLRAAVMLINLVINHHV